MCCKKLRKKYPDKANCFENKTAAEQHERKFVIDLPKDSKEQFCRIKMDGCFIQGNDSKKCDFVFVRCANDDTYYVELKGKDFKIGYEQLIITIKTHYPSPQEKTYGFIIVSRVSTNNRDRQDIRILKDEFQRKYGVKLVIASGTYKHQIE